MPRPVVQHATDAVVRITTSTICGTDLHILKGDVPSVTPGRILGHEGVGAVTEVGTAVAIVGAARAYLAPQSDVASVAAIGLIAIVPAQDFSASTGH